MKDKFILITEIIVIATTDKTFHKMFYTDTNLLDLLLTSHYQTKGNNDLPDPELDWLLEEYLYSAYPTQSFDRSTQIWLSKNPKIRVATVPRI